MTNTAEEPSITPDTQILTARSCRFAASMFNYGNIITVLLPPVGLLWLAASMVIYALNRHHPNEKVGYYTQQAAYRIYGLTGLIVAAAIFIPKNGMYYYLAIWALSIIVILPLSIRDLLRIRKDDWCDVEFEMTPRDYD
jgi:hypothetical protein